MQKKEFTHIDRLVFSCYLLLQDRVKEAISSFSKINVNMIPKQGQLRLQFDYLSAYIDILNGGSEGFKKAREIIKKY